MLADLVCPVGY